MTILLLAVVLAFSCAAQSVDQLTLINVRAEASTLEGKRTVKLVPTGPGGEIESMAIVKGLTFHNGTIEVELSGKPGSGASEGARGFAGIAFRVQADPNKYECFYLRPTNGRANDQLRRNHSTQYISHPDYTWARLRKESPGVYESYVDLQPGILTKYRVVVNGTKAQLYVHGAEQPALIVNDLKMGDVSGGIALWIGPGTEAHFTNLKVTAAP